VAEEQQAPDAETPVEPKAETETAAEAPTETTVEVEVESKPKSPTIPDPEKHWFWGTGRRKCAVARVRIRPGEGKFVINKREADKYFCSEFDRKMIRGPLQVTETAGRVDVFVNVNGGGPTGQAGAIVMGLGRALKVANPDYDEVLRKKGFLTRDARIVERKKYGRRGARRRFQFSKR